MIEAIKYKMKVQEDDNTILGMLILAVSFLSLIWIIRWFFSKKTPLIITRKFFDLNYKLDAQTEIKIWNTKTVLIFPVFFNFVKTFAHNLTRI